MTITKEGALTSFYTMNKAPIKHLRVYFSPKQTGSGVASPENVREISGWNNINIAQVGKNLFDIKTMTNRPGVTIVGNTFIGSAQDIRYYHDKRTESVPIFIPAGTTFIVHCTAYSEANVSTEGAGLNPWFEYKDGTTVRPWYTRNSATSPTYYSGIITATQDIVRYYWGWYNYAGNIWHISDLQFEISSVASEYEPCINSTHTIDWSNDIGTIYGGYVDLITGEVYQTYYHTQLNIANIFTNDDKYFWYTTTGESQIPAIKSENTGLMADRLQVISGLGVNNPENQITFYTNGIIRWKEEGTKTLNEYKEYLTNNPITISYEMATPQLVTTLTPQQLETFVGRNNIWSNADKVEIEYDLAESNEELYKRRNILLQGAPHIETATGAIANFNTDMVAPLKECKIHFEPIQEGSGDASLENVREINGWNSVNIQNSSKNMLNPAYYTKGSSYTLNGTTYTYDGNGTITLNGKSNGESSQVTFYWTQPFDCDYYFCGNCSFDTSVGDVYMWDITTSARPTKWDGTTKSGASYPSSNLQQVKLLAGHQVQLCVRVYSVSTTQLTNATAQPMLLPKTCTDTTFKPYNGATIPITFPAIGKNLFDKNAIPYQTGKYIYDVISGVPQYSNNSHYNVYRIPIKPATTYTFGPIKGGNSGSGPIWATIHENGITSRYVFNAGGSEGTTHTFTSYSSDRYLLLSVAIDDEYGYKCNDILQVEQGSTATAYEPYEYIYGGYIDLINGEIVAEWRKVYLKDLNWANYSSMIHWYTNVKTNSNVIAYTRECESYIYSDTLTPITNGNFLSEQVGEFTYYGPINSSHTQAENYKSNIWTRTPEAMENGTAANNWIKATYPNASLVYKLAYPIHYPLTPQIIKSLKGTNNIWANTNSSIDIKYWTH